MAGRARSSHLLAEDQVDVAQRCATSGIDRFAGTTPWTRLITSEPYFPSAHTWIHGRVINTMSTGTATIVAVHSRQAQLPPWRRHRWCTTTARGTARGGLASGPSGGPPGGPA
ncbi:flavin reductase family protein [Leifsonia sp. 21MFCrub1.1]|uniref:flavin reductase family protein n=1 Tax=Leifsonia sp. 21MFCrub1.1 TaxID=1798223 RepID=UPI002F911444